MLLLPLLLHLLVLLLRVLLVLLRADGRTRSPRQHTRKKLWATCAPVRSTCLVLQLQLLELLLLGRHLRLHLRAAAQRGAAE